MSYSSYDHDDLEPASTMRIERRIYFESGKADLSEAVKLPLAELLSLRAESAAAEQEVFDRLKEQAAAWEEQAGRTLFLDKALEYARTLPVTHTANQWEAPDEYRHIRSNMVYQMDYSISENTRYDSAAQKSVPYSWTLRWSLRTNAPGGYRQEKIAGQDRKVFASREELDKYLNGRIKAHDHYFTEISPAIPKEYADCFKVNGCLLPGYTIEGEEPAKAAELPAQEETAQPQTAATPERREPVNEVFSIFLDNRAEAQTGGPHGYWLSLPTSAEQVQEALKEIHITADNQQDLFIGGFSAPEGKLLELPDNLIKTASVDELNFLASQLQRLDAVELAELNAAMQSPAKMQTIGQLLDYAENTDCFVLINAKDNRSLGEYYLNDSGLFVVPDPWKPAIDTDRLGSFIASEEQGTFTDYGYILRTSDEWQRVHEGQPVPEPYRVMAYPAPELLREESKVQPEAAAPAKAPQPVTPILLNGQNSAERMKEITDRLETGIQELFESERYKAYLTTMSKFHSYSFNNTLLIAMQGGQLVAGYNKWRDDFHRNVKKGEKAIKILAPAPFKAKKEVQKLDAQGRPVMGKDGKPVTEVQEIQVPAFKIVSVFDVSQTEGEPLPSIGVEELTGSVERYGEFFKALEQTSPVPIGFEDIPGGSHGYYHLTEKRIAIQEGMSELQTLKTAMLSTPECMKAVAKKLLQYKPQNVVIDPVMYAKNGCPLMNPTAVSTLIDTVIPLADVLTPNIPEAEKIADMQISTVSDMEAAARKIYAMGCKAIVVKGGHHIGNAVDVLFDGENFYHFETSRIDTKNTHGTGCTFSSAIASQLAKGKSVPLAVESAKAYVTMAIEHSLAIGKGCGPTHHFYELYQHGLSKE